MQSAEEQAGCVTLTWKIENFGLFLAAENGNLESPVWKVEHTGGSAWGELFAYHSDSIILFGVHYLENDLLLYRCEMSLISSGGEVSLQNEYPGACFIEKNRLSSEKRQSIISNDTLTLHCRMWKETIRTRQLCIHSALYSVNYLWNIENFYPSFSYETYIDQVNFRFRVSLQKKSENGSHTVTVDVPYVESFLSFVDYSLSVKIGQELIVNLGCIFPYNRLIGDIEIHSQHTRINLQLESLVALHKVRQDQLGVLCDDLLHLYKEPLHTDATLSTAGKSFSVHRNILSARSPVFRVMFERNEMREGRSGVVVIDDVDSETVDRMLVFLYGDLLEEVQWQEASALYYAADKYAILPLKQKCAHILKTSLTVDNVYDALVLADRHADDHMMTYIVDFIRGKEEVISSDKWDNFQNSSPLLAAKVLREIFVKNMKK